MKTPTGEACLLVRENSEGERLVAATDAVAHRGQGRQAESVTSLGQVTAFYALLLHFPADARSLAKARRPLDGCRVRRRSGRAPIRRGHCVVETQLARLLAGEIPGAPARALERPFGALRRGSQRRFHRTAEIELSVAVRVRAGEFKVRPGRRVQYVRLRRGGARTRTLEDQLEAQLLEGGARHPQRRCGGAVAAQALAALLARGGRADQRELHGSVPDDVGLPGVPGASAGAGVAAAFSSAGLTRADRRCCFSCWRAFLASSFCLRA